MKLISVVISSFYLSLLEDSTLFSSNFDRGHFQSLLLRRMDLLSFHIRCRDSSKVWFGPVLRCKFSFTKEFPVP